MGRRRCLARLALVVKFWCGLVAQAPCRASPSTRKASSSASRQAGNGGSPAPSHATDDITLYGGPAGWGDGAGRVRREHPLGVHTELLDDHLGEAVPPRRPRLVPWWAPAGGPSAPAPAAAGRGHRPRWASRPGPVMTVSVPRSRLRRAIVFIKLGPAGAVKSGRLGGVQRLRKNLPDGALLRQFGTAVGVGGAFGSSGS